LSFAEYRRPTPLVNRKSVRVTLPILKSHVSSVRKPQGQLDSCAPLGLRWWNGSVRVSTDHQLIDKFSMCAHRQLDTFQLVRICARSKPVREYNIAEAVRSRLAVQIWNPSPQFVFVSDAFHFSRIAEISQSVVNTSWVLTLYVVIMISVKRNQNAIGWQRFSNFAKHISSHNIFIVQRMTSGVAGMDAACIALDYVSEMNEVRQVPSASQFGKQPFKCWLTLIWTVCATYGGKFRPLHPIIPVKKILQNSRTD
jgi:hypothetical protein